MGGDEPVLASARGREAGGRMSPEPTEEARQLAREFLVEQYGWSHAYEETVEALAELLDLVAMKTAAEAQR